MPSRHQNLPFDVIGNRFSLQRRAAPGKRRNGGSVRLVQARRGENQPVFTWIILLGALQKIGMVKRMTDQTETNAKAGAAIIPVTLFQQNCMLLWEQATQKAVVIDPGGDVPQIQAAIEQTGVTVEQIWLTHGHIDHVGGAAELRDARNVPIECPHREDKYLLNNVETSGRSSAITGVLNLAPARWLDEG